MSLRSGAGLDGLQPRQRRRIRASLDWSPQVHEQAIGRLAATAWAKHHPSPTSSTAWRGPTPPSWEALQVKRNQAEPLVSRDGKLLANAVQDTTRARQLAEQVLAAAGQQATDRGQLDVEAVA